MYVREINPSHYYLIGRFQKRAAKFAQEFTASANNVRFCNQTNKPFAKSISFSSYALIFYTDVNQVAQEVITLVRTVRVYGTEKQEFKRQFLCFPLIFFLLLGPLQ